MGHAYFVRGDTTKLCREQDSEEVLCLILLYILTFRDMERFITQTYAVALKQGILI